METAVVVLLAAIILFVVIVVFKAIMVIPQSQSAVVERLGKFKAVAPPGLNFLVPFLDKVRSRLDLREQVVSFPPQSVITQDNLTLSIDTVVYFQVTDSRAATYEISNYITGVEQLTTTTLRNLVGGMSLEDTLTSRDQINQQLRGVLDEATGRWGIRVARVELKAIDPPPSIQDSMEKQMRADREKRAMILNAEGDRESAIKKAEGQKQGLILDAEGSKQAAILQAEAERQSSILRAQGERAARYLQAQGQAKAIEKVFAAIKAGRPTPEVLAYQYLQTLPQMAQGDANKVWMVPSDYGKALEGFARSLGAPGEDGVFRYEPPEYSAEPPELDEEEVASWFDTTTDPDVAEAVRAAEAVARKEVGGLIGPGGSKNVAPAAEMLRGDQSELPPGSAEAHGSGTGQPPQQGPPQQGPSQQGPSQQTPGAQAGAQRPFSTQQGPVPPPGQQPPAPPPSTPRQGQPSQQGWQQQPWQQGHQWQQGGPEGEPGEEPGQGPRPQ